MFKVLVKMLNCLSPSESQGSLNRPKLITFIVLVKMPNHLSPGASQDRKKKQFVQLYSITPL